MCSVRGLNLDFRGTFPALGLWFMAPPSFDSEKGAGPIWARMPGRLDDQLPSHIAILTRVRALAFRRATSPTAPATANTSSSIPSCSGRPPSTQGGNTTAMPWSTSLLGPAVPRAAQSMALHTLVRPPTGQQPASGSQSQAMAAREKM